MCVAAFGAVAVPADGEVPLQQHPVEAVALQEALGAAGELGPGCGVVNQPGLDIGQVLKRNI